jgi:hypothetical protein
MVVTSVELNSVKKHFKSEELVKLSNNSAESTQNRLILQTIVLRIVSYGSLVVCSLMDEFLI